MHEFKVGDIVRIADKYLTSTEAWWGSNQTMEKLAGDAGARFKLVTVKQDYYSHSVSNSGTCIKMALIKGPSVDELPYLWRAEDLEPAKIRRIHLPSWQKLDYTATVIAIWAVMSIAMMWHIISTY
jgi:hypothetical protein